MRARGPEAVSVGETAQFQRGLELLAGGFKINDASRPGTTVVPGMGVGASSHGKEEERRAGDC